MTIDQYEKEKIDRLKFLAGRFYLTLRLKDSLKEGAETFGMGIAGIVVGAFAIMLSFIALVPLLTFEILRKRK